MATVQTADQTPATPEEIWAILRETAQQQRENERMWKEGIARREAEEAKRQVEEAKRREEYERRWEETRKRWDKADQRIDNANEKIGGLDNTFGEIIEHLVAPGIEERFGELGLHFEKVNSNVRIKQDGQRLAEVDLLLENQEIIMAVEVKAKVTTKDVEKHNIRLEKLRGYYDRGHDRRRILGTIAGAVFGPVEREAALKMGLYVVVQSGDTMKLEVPGDFVPQEW